MRPELDRLRTRHGAQSVLVCAPIAAQVGFSARNGPDHDAVSAALAAFDDCAVHPTFADVLNVGNALIHGGLVRAVGALNTVIAVYALVNEATVLDYDRDVEHVARVRPAPEHR